MIFSPNRASSLLTFCIRGGISVLIPMRTQLEKELLLLLCWLPLQWLSAFFTLPLLMHSGEHLRWGRRVQSRISNSLQSFNLCRPFEQIAAADIR